MTALTPKQAELLEIIQWHQRNHGVTPSFDEMKASMGLHSKSGVHRLICALEERGFIRRKYNRARCIEIVETPTLPSAGLHAAPVSDIVTELRRRGFVVGHYMRDSFTDTGGAKRFRRRFVEVAA